MFNGYYIYKLSPKCELLSVNKQYLGMHYVHMYHMYINFYMFMQFKYVVNSIYKHYILKAIKK